jgi:hypothetical protein
MVKIAVIGGTEEGKGLACWAMPVESSSDRAMPTPLQRRAN